MWQEYIIHVPYQFVTRWQYTCDLPVFDKMVEYLLLTSMWQDYSIQSCDLPVCNKMRVNMWLTSVWQDGSIHVTYQYVISWHYINDLPLCDKLTLYMWFTCILTSRHFINDLPLWNYTCDLPIFDKLALYQWLTSMWQGDNCLKEDSFWRWMDLVFNKRQFWNYQISFVNIQCILVLFQRENKSSSDSTTTPTRRLLFQNLPIILLDHQSYQVIFSMEAYGHWQ